MINCFFFSSSSSSSFLSFFLSFFLFFFFALEIAEMKDLMINFRCFKPMTMSLLFTDNRTKGEKTKTMVTPFVDGWDFVQTLGEGAYGE